MADPDLPDVTDPTIRAMVLSNHEPEETWAVAGLLSVHCRTCFRRWPCPSRDAAWEAERQAVRESLRRSDQRRTTRRRRWFGGKG